MYILHWKQLTPCDKMPYVILINTAKSQPETVSILNQFWTEELTNNASSHTCPRPQLTNYQSSTSLTYCQTVAP